MAVSKKTNATKKTKEATPVDTKKKVTFAQEKRVKMFHKDKALLKRKATDDQEQAAPASVKKTKSAIRKASKQQEDLDSPDEDEEKTSGDQVTDGVANDTVLDALTEEQEEALRKEILGDLVDEEGSDEDSSDDDQDDNIGDNDNVVSLNKKKDQSKAKQTAELSSTSGWVYVGHIPDAFTEKDMRQYFEQFGDIAHLRISRNKRGRSRHYGFIEFVAQDVAEIVVETMHNYMLDGRLLQCKIIPLERRNPRTFDHESKPKPRATAPVERQRKIRNQNKSMQVYLTRAEGLVKSENKKRQQLKELKIDYEFPGYAASRLQWAPKFKVKLEQEIKAKEELKEKAEKMKNDKAKLDEESQPAKVTVS